MMLARHLRGRPVTVMTASLAVVDVLRDDEQVELVVLGGALRRHYLSLVGVLTEDALAQVRADRAFLGASGVRADGQVLDTTGSRCPSSGRSSPPQTRSCCWPTGTSSRVRVTAGSAPDGHQRARDQRRSRPATRSRRVVAAGVEVLICVKLAILGGGGFRVPLVYGALLRDTSEQRVDRRRRCTTSTRTASPRSGTCWPRWAAATRPPRVVSATTDLDTALADADFVFSAIRVGGLAGRTNDERVALDLGLLGQETTGPGGLAYGLRTVPVAVEVAERVKALAPRRLGHQLHQPGRDDHRGDAAGAGRARRRHLRLADRAGPACRPRARARPGPHVAGLRGAQPPRLAARAARTTAGTCCPTSSATTPCSPASRRAASSAPTGSAAWAPCPTSTSTTTTSPATRWPRSAAARRPGASSCSTSSAASTTRSPPTPRRPSGSGTGCAGSVTPAT